MDCCASAMSMGSQRCEVLAACGAESTTSADLEGSLTEVLCNELDEMIRLDRRYSISAIAVKLHYDIVTNGLRQSCIHKPHMSGRDSIVLQKRQSRKVEYEISELLLGIEPVTVTLAVHLDGGIGQIPDEKEWHDWLTRNMPAGVRGIDVKYAGPSSSVLLLVSIPRILWNYLPGNPGYVFIGFDDIVRGAPHRLGSMVNLPHRKFKQGI